MICSVGFINSIFICNHHVNKKATCRNSVTKIFYCLQKKQQQLNCQVISQLLICRENYLEATVRIPGREREVRITFSVIILDFVSVYLILCLLILAT